MLSIDPGTRVLGAALWSDGRLISAWITLSPLDARPPLADTAYVEHMQYRPNTPNPQSLIDVMAHSMAYAARAATTINLVTPQVWKGNVPKAIHHPRIRARLDKNETAVLHFALRGCPKKHHKEILDAVGIGLWALGRKA